MKRFTGSFWPQSIRQPLIPSGLYIPVTRPLNGPSFCTNRTASSPSPAEVRAASRAANCYSNSTTSRANGDKIHSHLQVNSHNGADRVCDGSRRNHLQPRFGQFDRNPPQGELFWGPEVIRDVEVGSSVDELRPIGPDSAHKGRFVSHGKVQCYRVTVAVDDLGDCGHPSTTDRSSVHPFWPSTHVTLRFRQYSCGRDWTAVHGATPRSRTLPAGFRPANHFLAPPSGRWSQRCHFRW